MAPRTRFTVAGLLLAASVTVGLTFSALGGEEWPAPCGVKTFKLLIEIRYVAIEHLA